MCLVSALQATYKRKKALLIKTNNIYVYILQQNPTSGYSRIQFMLLAVIISRMQYCISQHNCDVFNYVNTNVDFVASN